MLRLRYVGRVPDHAVNIAYAESKQLVPPENVSLLDMSYLRAENLSSYVGGEFDVDLLGTNRVDTDEFALSPRSVLSPNVKTPTPLFYKYVIGRGVYGVEASVSTPANLELARLEIRKQLQILDRFNNKIVGPAWDIEVTGINANGWYTVVLYLERRQNADETFKVRYQARRLSDDASLPNFIEVINAVPILALGTDYSIQLFSDGYAVNGLADANNSPAIGIFYKGTRPYGRINVYNTGGISLPPDRINLELDVGGWVTVLISTKTIAQLVAEINQLGIEYEAAALSENPTAARLFRHNVVNVYTSGTPIRQRGYVHVKYDKETRVRCLLPYRDPDYLPWYPRVDMGQFTQDGILSGASCKFVFKPQGPEVIMPPGQDGHLYDRLDEQPIYLAPQMLQLRRPSVDPSSIVVNRGNQELTGVVADYDQLNSVLFLNRQIGDISSVWVSYSYEEGTLLYTGVDLNPLGPHMPRLYGRYVGIYMTPATIYGPVPPCTYAPGPDGDIIPIALSRTLFHVVGDTIQEIQDVVASVKFDTGDDTHAILLGIFRVGQTAVVEEVKLTDTRSQGGGISEAIDPSKIPGGREGEMFWDIGLYDGEPFPPTAIIAEYPSQILGTGIAPLVRDPMADPSGFYMPSGLLTDVDVLNKMNRHKAGGVLVITSPEDSLNA